MSDEKKEVKAFTVGFNIGMFTILYSWLCLMIPSLGLQAIFNLSVDDKMYKLLLTVFQIICAILGNKFAIKASTKNIKLDGTALKTVLVSVLTTSIFVFVLEIIIGTGTLVPFKNILGFIVLLITYVISNNYFIKKLY